jgi:hypothetical protein
MIRSLYVVFIHLLSDANKMRSLIQSRDQKAEENFPFSFSKTIQFLNLSHTCSLASDYDKLKDFRLVENIPYRVGNGDGSNL